MPDIYLYDPRFINPADIILSNPTVLNTTVNTSVSLVGSRAATRTGFSTLGTEINVLLYVGEATPSDVKLRYIGYIEAGGGSTNIDVFVLGNLATGLVGTVSITGDANVSPTGNLATGLVGTVTITGDANVSPTGSLSIGLVGTVSITGDANVTLAGLLATGLVGSVTITGNADVSLSGLLATGLVGSVTITTTGATFVLRRKLGHIIDDGGYWGSNG